MISFTRSSSSLNELLARGIYTIPAGLPFAQDLAAGILASVQTPEQLAEIKILLPSRRAAQALKTAFIEQSEGQALFLPCLLYTSPSPRDGLLSRMPSSA